MTFSLPIKGQEKLRFKNFASMVKTDHIVIYDFECYMQKNDANSHSKPVQHIPIAVSALRICVNYRHNSELFTYLGQDCVEKFIDWLLFQEQEIEGLAMHRYVALNMTGDDWINFVDTDSCEMCGQQFSNQAEKYRDHCHLLPSGRLRFTLCNRCNLTYGGRSRHIPCFAHNAMRYDQNLIVKRLAEVSKRDDIRLRVLSKTKDTYLAIHFGRFIFLDTYQFLPSSLSDLVESKRSTKQGLDFPLLRYYTAPSSTKYDLLSKRKGVFPFQYFDGIEKLGLRHLPSKDRFYNELEKRDISDDDFAHACNVWNKMNCRTFKDYLLLYLEGDVLLLAVIVEDFRKVTMVNFGIDPAAYYSTPHIGLNAMLKFTDIELEVFRDIDMYHFIKNNIRGGVATINHRHATINSPDFRHQYDVDKPLSEIVYFDCTGLYSFCLSQCLPLGNFRWLSRRERERFDLDSYGSHSKKGFILEVDLDYPDNLHDYHNCYPLAPDKIEIAPSDWSPFMHEMAARLRLNIKGGGKKLIPHLGPRKNYGIHYRNLKLYLKLGLILKKVHRILEFDQSPWMRPYIDFNTAQRQKSTSQFVSDFWKLMSNSVYGEYFFVVLVIRSWMSDNFH